MYMYVYVYICIYIYIYTIAWSGEPEAQGRHAREHEGGQRRDEEELYTNYY